MYLAGQLARHIPPPPPPANSVQAARLSYISALSQLGTIICKLKDYGVDSMPFFISVQNRPNIIFSHSARSQQFGEVSV